jgi:hypothetical protein
MNRLALAALAAAALPAVVAAQPYPAAPYPPAPYAAAPHGGYRAEAKQDRRELRDDRWDLHHLETLLARYDAACARRDRRAMAAAEYDVLRALEREIVEARAELHRSAAEARDPWAGRRAAGFDRRDYRDDRRDLARLEGIRDELWRLRGRMGWRAVDRKHALVAELVEVARAELREDRRERREDRREAWAYGR